MQTEHGRERDYEAADRRLPLLWAGWAIAPFAWMMHLSVGYVLAPWVCRNGLQPALYAVTGAAFVIAVGALLLNWRSWRNWSARVRSDANVVFRRGRFLGLVGTLVSLMFLLVIIAQSIPILILGGCS